MIYYKEGIKLGWRPEIERLLVPLDIIMHQHGTNLMITCGTDGHGPDDPHTHGFAIDIRTHDLRHPVEVRDEIAVMAGNSYYILLEDPGQDNEHIHIQVYKGLWQEILAKETPNADTTQG